MNKDNENPFAVASTLAPAYTIKVGPVGIVVAIALGLLILIILICLVKHCCKCSCCPKKRKPSLKDRILKKIGLRKSSPPFAVNV